ncbi:hypothetical protein H6F46_10650 [Limnothrix sp. FACHB-1083]|uniref:hypothetical protein n=1 Tax=unclassified Limnothrix TaxID=2632864 RepID=UPI001680C71F|nr:MULTISPECIES: hypothetical protein [unclassified Limnothrix]MBD2161151.1 hypothetical protein [Limnothrix sp. FACHB-1083]MBD2192486.1 hypothetical protein [Limnothrix sp. FACHB-1088]
MNIFLFSLEKTESKFTHASLREHLLENEDFKIAVSLPSIGWAQSPVSIADDYLFALYFGESISPFCQEISCTIEHSRECHQVIFDVHPIKEEATLNSLVSEILRFSDVDDEKESGMRFWDTLEEFRIDLSPDQILTFPELADEYMINSIAGINDWDFSPDEEREHYERYPEEEFGFFHSYVSPHIGYAVYTSTWAWIVPSYSAHREFIPDLDQLLLLYAGFGSKLPVMQEANVFSIGVLQPVVLNKLVMMFFPRENYEIARECTDAILRKMMTFTKKECSQKSVASLFQAPRPLLSFSVKLSEDGHLMIIRDEVAQYIFFRSSLASLSNLQEGSYEFALEQLSEKIGDLAGHSVDISCPWEKIDDDLFEQLCYDLIIHSPDFDPDTRQKMGKSRSRDGGRDIEIYTYSRLNRPRRKWIIQCKLLKRGATLAGSKVQVSDVIDQYGAGGFCIMTNGVIDATLHDKLDGISRNKKIEIEKWDYLKIERLLATPKYRNIKKRYFGI